MHPEGRFLQEIPICRPRSSGICAAMMEEAGPHAPPPVHCLVSRDSRTWERETLAKGLSGPRPLSACPRIDGRLVISSRCLTSRVASATWLASTVPASMVSRGRSSARQAPPFSRPHFTVSAPCRAPPARCPASAPRAASAAGSHPEDRARRRARRCGSSP